MTTRANSQRMPYFFLGLVMSWSAAEAEQILLASFDGAKGSTRSWEAQPDPTMGGTSRGTFKVENELGVFDGTLRQNFVTQFPGYIEANTVDDMPPFPDISSCTAIDLTVRSIANYSGYFFSFGKQVGYQTGYFSPLVVAPGKFVTVSIPLSNFTNCWDTGFGEPLRTCQADSDCCPDKKIVQNLKQLSIWAARDIGKYHLEVKSIEASGCGKQAFSEVLAPISI